MKQETKNKILDWYQRFPFVFDKTDSLALKLGEEYARYSVFPLPNNIFKAFELCKYKDLKLVILGLDPYPGTVKYNGEQVPYATGLSFANPPEARVVAPSLMKIREAVVESGHLFLDQTLETWANQGCLMLNTALTIRQKETKSHIELWKDFTTALITAIGCEPGLIWILWGKDAQEYEQYIDKNYCYILKAEHPVASSYQGRDWEYNDCFNEANNIIEGLYGKESKIIW